jgi:hypothetical protein
MYNNGTSDILSGSQRGNLKHLKLMASVQKKNIVTWRILQHPRRMKRFLEIKKASVYLCNSRDLLFVSVQAGVFEMKLTGSKGS